MTTPDTIEAVAEAIEWTGFDDIHNECSHGADGLGKCRAMDITPLAKAAIAADRKALAEQGYVIVNAEELDELKLALGLMP